VQNGRGMGPGGFIARGGPGVGTGAHVLGWLIFAALLGLFIVALLYLIRHWQQPMARGRGGRFPGAPTDPAYQTLRMRFASGEISSDEFAQRAAELGATAPGGPTPWFPPRAGTSPGTPGT
jgi:uncharacterized membrane protein